MGHIKLLIIFVATLVLLPSCKANVNLDSIDTLLIAKETNFDEQEIRHTVMTSTNINPNLVIPKLENAWELSSNESGMIANNNVVRVAIAHQLMEHKSRHYDECYKFIIKSLNSTEDDVASPAISALSSAKGSESLTMLFKHAKDNNHSRVIASLRAIQDRRLLANHNSDRESEIGYINHQSELLCKDAGNHSWYIDFCQPNRGTSG